MFAAVGTIVLAGTFFSPNQTLESMGTAAFIIIIAILSCHFTPTEHGKTFLSFSLYLRAIKP